MKMRKLLLFLFTCITALAAAMLYDPRGALPESEAFEIVEDFNIYNVFDAGIADFNSDGEIDRWTVNHSAAQWVNLSGEAQSWSLPRNHINLAGLYQDANLPGFEAGSGPVPARRPIRIYMQEAHFIVEMDAAADEKSVKGWFDIPWRTEYEAFGGASVLKTICDTAPNCNRLTFDVPKGGRVELLPVPAPSDGFPITIALDPATDLSTVQLGSAGTEPKAHIFTYHSKDRHSLAIARISEEAGEVLFVSRGGARGLLPSVHPEAQDEFFQWTKSGYQNNIALSGIDKNGCPGRQAGWHDINNDGRLDLYQVCGRNGSGADNGTARNRLYIQQPDGSFFEDAAAFGLDFEGVGIFRFLPQSQSGSAATMLWITEGGIALFEKGETQFAQRWWINAPLTGTEKVVLVETDTPGDWNVLVFSQHGNLLFPASINAPELRELEDLGLPAASSGGAVADFNGDGMRDILAFPQGIFLREGDRFRASTLIDLSWAETRREVRVVPFDHDKDGDLDLWVLAQSGDEVSRVVRATYNRSPSLLQGWFENYYGRDRLLDRYWRSVLYENKQDTGRLHVLRPEDISGGIGGFGQTFVSQVRLVTDQKAPQTRFLFSGMDEPSRFSQTFPYIFQSLPDGSEIIAVEPMQFQAGQMPDPLTEAGK